MEVRATGAGGSPGIFYLPFVISAMGNQPSYELCHENDRPIWKRREGGGAGVRDIGQELVVERELRRIAEEKLAAERDRADSAEKRIENAIGDTRNG